MLIDVLFVCYFIGVAWTAYTMTAALLDEPSEQPICVSCAILVCFAWPFYLLKWVMR